MQLRGFTDLCAPAHTYLIISVVAITIIFFQNYYSGSFNNRTYCLGMFNCDVPSLPLLFFIKIIYVLFWTWVLNLICQQGAPIISWLLVLFPFVLFFVLLASVIFSNRDQII